MYSCSLKLGIDHKVKIIPVMRWQLHKVNPDPPHLALTLNVTTWPKIAAEAPAIISAF